MSDAIRRVDILRRVYKAAAGDSFNQLERSAKEATAELKIANDLTTEKIDQLVPDVQSPYLADQPYYDAKVIYNTPKETQWREVKTFEENLKDATAFKNLKKLNII